MGNARPGLRSPHRPRKNVHWKSAECPQPPGKPGMEASSGGDGTAVALRWAPPRRDGGAPITGYLVECNRLGGPLWVRTNPQVVQRPELILTGLEPGYRYQFRISAENGVGVSQPSEVSDILTVTLDRAAVAIPRFIEGLQDAKSMENEKSEFNVHFEGAPPPTICWFKDGFEIFSSRRTAIVTEGNRSSLIFHQTSLNDEGEIKCTATNRAGHAVTRARLSLEAAPRVRLPRQYEEGLLYETGETVFLKVSVVGKPSPEIEWRHDGQLLESSDEHEISNTDKFSTIRINNASRTDRGEYQITAKNKVGEDSASFLVTITARPDPPIRISVAQNSDKSVSLSWINPDDDGGCQISNYIIEYYRKGWNVWLKATTSRKLTATLFDLIEGSEYRFRVKAESPYGVSEPSAETQAIFIPGKSSSMDFNPMDIDKPLEYLKVEDRNPTPQAVPRRKRPTSPNSEDEEHAKKYSLDIPNLRKQRNADPNTERQLNKGKEFNNEQRKFSIDDKMRHGSSEFMLVLYPEEDKTTEDKRKSFQLDLEDAMSPPPMSLSAPDLGYGYFPIRPLRNSVSSTELLHEHAMDRFYQVVALKEAEKARSNKEAIQNSVPKVMPEIKIQSTESNGSFSFKTNQVSEENTNDKNKPLEREKETMSPEIYDTDEAISNESLSREKSEERSSLFEEDYTASTVSTGDSEFSDSDSLAEDVTKLRNILEESSTYHPSEKVYKGVSQTQNISGQAVEILTKPAPLPDPNFIPKPILKKREPELPPIPAKEEKPVKVSEPLLKKVPLFKKFAKFPLEKNLQPEKKGAKKKDKKGKVVSAPIAEKETKPEKEKDKPEVQDSCQDEGRSAIEHYGNLVKEFGKNKRVQPTLYTNTEDLKKAAAIQQKQVTPQKPKPQPVKKPPVVVKKENSKPIPKESISNVKNGQIKQEKKPIEQQKPKAQPKQRPQPQSQEKPHIIETVAMPINFSQLNAEAESNVRSLFDYIIDIFMLIVAFWLYIFKDERLAIPFLGLTMYRQIHSAVKNKMPSWLTKRKDSIE